MPAIVSIDHPLSLYCPHVDGAILADGPNLTLKLSRKKETSLALCGLAGWLVSCMHRHGSDRPHGVRREWQDPWQFEADKAATTNQPVMGCCTAR